MIKRGYQQYYSYVFLIGSCLIWYGTSETNPEIYLIVIPCMLLIFSRRYRIVACLFLGMFYAELTAVHQREWVFPEKLVPANHLLIGTIEGLVSKRQGSIRFRFKLKEINHQAISASQNIYLRLACYRHCADYKSEQTWQLLVRLKPPNGYINPNNFDYEKWLYSEQFKATGYIVPSKQSKLLSMGFGTDHFREQIRDYFIENIDDLAVKGSVIALTLGDKSFLENRQQQLLAKNGLSHLMAISGMHIGLAAIPGFLLGGLFWRFSKTLKRYDKASVQWGFCLFSAVFYAALSGFALPAWRAIIMLVVFTVAQISRSSISTHSRFSLALWIILIFQPLAPLQMSFWLSFCATGILIMLSHLPQPKQKLYNLFKLQLQLYLMLLPIQLLIFGSSSMLSPLINLVAIPLVSLLLLPLLFLQVILIVLSEMIFSNVSLLMQLSNFVLIIITFLFEQFWSLLYLLEPVSNVMQIRLAGLSSVHLVVYPLFLLLLLPLNFTLKIVICAILFSFSKPKTTETVFKMLVMDVGQGLSIITRFDHKIFIYDTAYGNEQSAVATMTLMPWLESINQNNIELLMISHNDADHSGGLMALSEMLTINKLLHGPDVEISQSLHNKNINISTCHQGQSWHWKQLEFQMLSPKMTKIIPENDEPIKKVRVNETLQKGNNSSCVLLLNIYGKKILLTGDIEQQAEAELIKAYPNLSVDILFAPHHGSKTSSTVQFVNQMNAKVGFISSGFLNRFNLPAKEVVKRYMKSDVRLFNTASSGAIELTIDELGKVSIKQWRIENASLWTRH